MRALFLMQESIKGSIWLFWLPLVLAIFAIILITIAGNVLVIGTKLGFFSPFLEWGFYILVMVILVWLIALPVYGVFGKPVLSLESVASGESIVDYKTLRKVAQQLINAKGLPEEQRENLAGALGLGSDLCPPLAEVINTQKESSTKIIREYAVLVFVATAVSQSGRLDAITVLATNFRMVRMLINHFGYRPPLPVLLKVYAQIFLAVFVADAVDDLDLASFLEYAGAGGIFGMVPGAKLVTNSIFDGTINALFTLRVGFVTRKCLLNTGSTMTNSTIRKVANQEARQELKPSLKQGMACIPNAANTIFE